jgi:hypothetical protein
LREAFSVVGAQAEQLRATGQAGSGNALATENDALRRHAADAASRMVLRLRRRHAEP